MLGIMGAHVIGYCVIKVLVFLWHTWDFVTHRIVHRLVTYQEVEWHVSQSQCLHRRLFLYPSLV